MSACDATVYTAIVRLWGRNGNRSVILPFPSKLSRILGWKAGDIVVAEVVENEKGTRILRVKRHSLLSNTNLVATVVRRLGKEARG